MLRQRKTILWFQTESQYIQCEKEEIKERGLHEPHNGNFWKTNTKVNQRRISSMNGQDQKFKCEKCSFKCQNRIELCKHNIKEHSNHEDFNCNECDFQTTTDLLLRNHKQLKHEISAQRIEIKCDS